MFGTLYVFTFAFTVSYFDALSFEHQFLLVDGKTLHSFSALENVVHV